MRVADRIYAPAASALKLVATGERPNPCRVDECEHTQPLTRIHNEDLSGVVLRMLSMFDIVDTHGADSSMKGTASMASSISRFPTGTVLEVVDDGPAHTMAQAEDWSKALFGLEPSASAFDDTVPDTAGAAHRSYVGAKGRNADLKEALGMPKLRYPSYLHGAAKMFGAGEF